MCDKIYIDSIQLGIP